MRNPAIPVLPCPANPLSSPLHDPPPPLRPHLSTGLAAVWLLASCSREEPVKVYEVIIPPAAQAGAQAATPSDSAAMGAAAAATAAPVRWTIPADWEAQPLAPMINRGHFLLPGTTGSRPVLTISSFPGTVGGMAANLNRWRRQLGLPELPADEVEKATESRKAGQQHAHRRPLRRQTPRRQPVRHDRSRARPARRKLVFQTDRLAGRDGGAQGCLRCLPFDHHHRRWLPATSACQPCNPAACHSPQAPPPRPPAPDAPDAAKPVYQTPAGWKEMPASGMRAASFSIPGPDDLNADVSVVKLGGDGGGDLQNVNLWLQQLGLPAIDANALGERLSSRNARPECLPIVRRLQHRQNPAKCLPRQDHRRHHHQGRCHLGRALARRTPPTGAGKGKIPFLPDITPPALSHPMSSPRPINPLRSLGKALSSLKLTVWLMAAAMVLIFFATIDQVHLGIHEVVRIYFRSFLSYYDVRTGGGWDEAASRAAARTGFPPLAARRLHARHACSSSIWSPPISPASS